jgi:DNA-binding beta-propeller fold protein YncE
MTAHHCAVLRTICLCAAIGPASLAPAQDPGTRRLLYVAEPGIRNYPQDGGTGIIVFDIDHGHRFVRRITVPALGTDPRPEAVKGVCASSATGHLYVSTTKTLTCLELATDKVIWSRAYDSGCDRMSITPDGKALYEPTLEGKYWHVIDAENGDEMARIITDSGAHNTVFAPDGKHVYLAGLHSPLLAVADPRTNTIEKQVGPFAAEIRPFTVNGSSTRCYVNVNGLLGFEVGDLVTGKKLWRVQVEGFSAGDTKRHGCPSHGVGLTPDEKEIWVTDAHNSRLHLFDNTVSPPKQLESILLRDQPGWITFGIDGRYAYPSTGDVIDVKSRKIIAGLTDEKERTVQSEKLLEIDFDGGKPVRTGDQFGVGRVMQ